MMTEKEKERRKKAESYRPADTQPTMTGPQIVGMDHVNQPTPPEGKMAWHGISPQRNAFPLPADVKGPIRARATRKAKGVPSTG